MISFVVFVGVNIFPVRSHGLFLDGEALSLPLLESLRFSEAAALETVKILSQTKSFSQSVLEWQCIS